jgi:hypothetical protein
MEKNLVVTRKELQTQILAKSSRNNQITPCMHICYE